MTCSQIFRRVKSVHEFSEVSFSIFLATSFVHELGWFRLGDVPGQQASSAEPEESQLRPSFLLLGGGCNLAL